MKRVLVRMAAIFLGAGIALPALANEAATAQMTSADLGNGVFEYTITLTNTGTSNLETFWYAWVPGENLMPVSPTSIQSPPNWTANITHETSNPGYDGSSSAYDGYAIQFVTASSASPAPLTPGASLVFRFDSTSTPQTLAGDSPLYAGTPIGRSFVYAGAPFSDAGDEFDVTMGAAPPVISIAASRGQTAESGGQKGILIVTRTGDASADLTVNYQVKGTAAKTQYEPLSGTVVIPAGKTSAKIKVKAIDDHIAEGNTAVAIKLLPGNGYAVGSPAKAKVKIIDAGS